METSKRWKAPLYAVSIIYVAALLFIILFKFGSASIIRGGWRINFIPFQWLDYPKDIVFDNVFGNIGLFIPFGFLLPLLFCKLHTGATILAGFLLSLFFEATQYVTQIGGADVDDLILNTCGAICGALFFHLLKRVTRDESKLQRNGLLFVIMLGTALFAVMLFV